MIGYSSESKYTRTLRFLARTVTSLAVILVFVVFLVVSGWFNPQPELLSIRGVETLDSAPNLPAPPPPPESQSKPEPPPPPPPAVQPLELPKLDLSVDDLAPPIKAMQAEQEMEFEMKPAEFSDAVQAVKPRALFSSSQLDGQPRLMNRPLVSFPASQKIKGVKEGHVTLEVLINAAGRVSIRRVISSSHPDFIPMAKEFAAKSRFSPPKKNGRTVNAVFQWPLVLR